MSSFKHFLTRCVLGLFEFFGSRFGSPSTKAEIKRWRRKRLEDTAFWQATLEAARKETQSMLREALQNSDFEGILKRKRDEQTVQKLKFSKMMVLEVAKRISKNRKKRSSRTVCRRVN